MSDISRSLFIARESVALETGSEDGLAWPIQVMKAGFAHGEVMTDDPSLAGLPHYFPQEVVAEVAEACNNARFGRRHPQSQDEETDPRRIAGWLDGGKIQSGTARATMHLFDNEKELRDKLLSARKAGKLDLFGTSILAYFAWKKGTAEGRVALVAQRLGRLVSVDMVTEAGAGGKFLMAYAASLHAAEAEFKGGKVKAQIRGGKIQKARLRPLVESGLCGEDRLQLGMDLMLGVKEAMGDGIGGFENLLDAYKQVTGAALGVHFTRGGGFWAKAAESIAMSDFPNILLNSMTKRLIQDYQEFPLVSNLEKLYTPTKFSDFKPQDRVRMGYLVDLPQVSEAAGFTELTKPTDEKISYAVNKFGGIFTITEETIRSNDLGGVMLFINRMARASRHTLCTFISNFFITPPNYDPDGFGWFEAAHHKNLGTTALSAAELDVQAIALRNQTEKDSGNRMALPLEWIMVPAELEPAARQINRGFSATNGWNGKFGADDENIIVNPLLIDTDDWFGGCFPASAPFLEIGFLDGIEVPQLMLTSQDQLPAGSTMFTNDEIRCKCSFVFGGKPIDFRGVFAEKID